MASQLGFTFTDSSVTDQTCNVLSSTLARTVASLRCHRKHLISPLWPSRVCLRSSSALPSVRAKMEAPKTPPEHASLPSTGYWRPTQILSRDQAAWLPYSYCE